MTTDTQQEWLFRVHVVDRAGTVTSIASAFSNEGINLDSVVAHGVDKDSEIDGSILLTFSATEEDKDLLVRKVKRLSKVTRLDVHPYDSMSLRKSVVVQTSMRLTPMDVAGEEHFLTCELISEQVGSWTYFLAGVPNELEPVIRRLAHAGIVQDIVYAVLSL